MNPESVEYDKGTEEVSIEFTDEHGNKRLEIILFKNEAVQLWKMLAKKLSYKGKQRIIKENKEVHSGVGGETESKKMRAIEI